MKIKSLTSLIVLLSSACILSAQTFTIAWDKQSPVHGTTMDGTIKQNGTLVSQDIGNKEIFFRYSIDKLFAGHDGAFCFGDNCFFLFEGVDDPRERPGQNLQGFGTLPIYSFINVNGVAGSTTLDFTLFDGNNEADSLAFSVTYIVELAASVPLASNVGIALGPNPATNSLSINGNALTTVKGYNLYSSDGGLVRTFISAPASSQQFNVGDVTPGRYFLLLTNTDGSVMQLPVVISR